MSTGLSIGIQAKQARQALGLSQSVAAVKAGITRNHASQIENDRFTGSLRILNNYLSVLGLQLCVQSASVPSWEELDAVFASEGDDALG